MEDLSINTMISENEYNQYFQALTNVESVACFGVRKVSLNKFGQLVRSHNSQIPGVLSILIQLIQTLWNRQIFKTNQIKTEKIEAILADSLETINSINARLKDFMDEKGILKPDYRHESKEHIHYSWQAVRLYNRRLRSMKAWNRYVDSKSWSRAINSRLGQDIKITTKILDPNSSSQNLNEIKQVKSKCPFYTFSKMIQKNRIGEKFNYKKARPYLQLIGGVTQSVEESESLASLMFPGDKKFKEFAKKSFEHPINWQNFQEYIEDFRLLFTLDKAGEKLILINCEKEAFNTPDYSRYLSPLFKKIDGLPTCFLLAKAIKYHFIIEKSDEHLLKQDLLKKLVDHCISQEWNISLEEIAIWIPKIKEIFSENKQEVALSDIYARIIRPLINQKKVNEKEALEFTERFLTLEDKIN